MTNLRSKFSLLLLLMTLVCRGTFVLAASTTPEAVLVQMHTNRETIYTNYKFGVAGDGQELDWCFHEPKIEWDVIDVGKPKKHIIVHQAPGAGSFSANITSHRAIMRKIFSRWPVSDFHSLSFGGLGAPPDWSWSVAIALASSRSEDYRDYKAHYPHSRITGLNGLFEHLANSSNAYGAIGEAFAEIGADVEVSGVEKVKDSRAQDLPFYLRLRALGIAGKTRVIYDAGSVSFAIKARHNPQGGADGKQQFSSETNRAQAAAASRRSP